MKSFRPRASSPGRSPLSWKHVQWVVAAIALVAVVIAWAILSERDPSSGSSEAFTSSPSSSSSQKSPPGITVRSTISASGSLRTTTQVTFERPPPKLGLSVPMQGPGISTDLRPVVQHLRVLVDGTRVPGTPTRLRSGDSTVVNLPPDTTAVELTYRARGVVAESEPAPPGRALVLATPLSLSARSNLPTTIVLDGSQILNLGCWTPDAPLAVCGTASGGNWEFHLPAGSDDVTVIAQINLSPQHRE